MEKIIRWASETGVGLEHLILNMEADGITASSMVIGNRFGAPYAAHYQLRCDAQWRLRQVSAALPNGSSLALSVSDDGVWTGSGGKAIDDLRGCTDVDISATPFTNTLPIRRLQLQQGQRQEIRVAYLAIPAMTITAARQAYTCLKVGQSYLYEGLFRDFSATLQVDEDGLVLNYPSLFRRVRTL